jgi:GTP cyclohydrolase I
MHKNPVTTLLQLIDEDPNREGLKDTPKRFLKAWEFWTSGYKGGQDIASILTTFNNENHDELIFQGAIPFYSLCEHHLASFFGMAHVGYLPSDRIVGLSKMPRLVEVFSRRLTIQERICTQVADAMMEHLKPRGVGVVLHCRHLCMESRGVQKPGTITITSALRGALKDHGDLRAEFFSMVASASTGLTKP